MGLSKSIFDLERDVTTYKVKIGEMRNILSDHYQEDVTQKMDVVKVFMGDVDSRMADIVNQSGQVENVIHRFLAMLLALDNPNKEFLKLLVAQTEDLLREKM